MADENRLTPQEARTRFGELMDPKTRTYRHFSAETGEWRPECERGPTGLELRHYRLYAPVTTTSTRPPYRPRRKD